MTAKSITTEPEEQPDRLAYVTELFTRVMNEFIMSGELITDDRTWDEIREATGLEIPLHRPIVPYEPDEEDLQHLRQRQLGPDNY